jgi:hypothetical protein
MFKIILVGLAIALRSRRKLALKNVAVHHQLETNSGPNFLHQTTSDPISPTPIAGRRWMEPILRRLLSKQHQSGGTPKELEYFSLSRVICSVHGSFFDWEKI